MSTDLCGDSLLVQIVDTRYTVPACASVATVLESAFSQDASFIASALRATPSNQRLDFIASGSVTVMPEPRDTGDTSNLFSTLRNNIPAIRDRSTSERGWETVISGRRRLGLCLRANEVEPTAPFSLSCEFH